MMTEEFVFQPCRPAVAFQCSCSSEEGHIGLLYLLVDGFPMWDLFQLKCLRGSGDQTQCLLILIISFLEMKCLWKTKCNGENDNKTKSSSKSTTFLVENWYKNTCVFRPGSVVCACKHGYPRGWDGGSLEHRSSGPAMQHRETLSLRKRKKKKCHTLWGKKTKLCYFIFYFWAFSKL